MFGLNRKKQITTQTTKSDLVKLENGIGLYTLPEGYNLWLDKNKYLDSEIINAGYFEKDSTLLCTKLVNKGDVILDVGANTGYYTLLFAKLVGEEGSVYAFEPTSYYMNTLKKNVEANSYANIHLNQFGLSNEDAEMEISIGNSSATLHWVENETPKGTEKITLKPLDEFVTSEKIDRLDFIKIDIDGHEPLFFQGAKETLSRFNPTILLEVNHANYLQAGFNAWDFYNFLKENGYRIYSEGLREYTDLNTFLKECGNFAYSANIIISKSEILSK